MSTISAAQRDALYDLIIDRLSGISDIAKAIQAKKYDHAECIGRDYCDELQLLLDDLGIGERDGKPITLNTPPDVLRRILPRLRERARRYSASLEAQWREGRQIEERNRLASQACEHVLADLVDSRSAPEAAADTIASPELGAP